MMSRRRGVRAYARSVYTRVNALRPRANPSVIQLPANRPGGRPRTGELALL
jgi:hypothetical protein